MFIGTRRWLFFILFWGKFFFFFIEVMIVGWIGCWRRVVGDGIDLGMLQNLILVEVWYWNWSYGEPFFVGERRQILRWWWYTCIYPCLVFLYPCCSVVFRKNKRFWGGKKTAQGYLILWVLAVHICISCVLSSLIVQSNHGVTFITLHLYMENPDRFCVCLRLLQRSWSVMGSESMDKGSCWLETCLEWW